MHAHIPTLWQTLIIALIAIIAVIPMVRILRRLGYSGWWAVLAPVSPFNLIGLWVLAYAKWSHRAS
jgi:hypothetical protein